MNVPTDISIHALLTDFAPKMAKEVIAASGRAAELVGTRFTLVLDISGKIVSYDVKDGADFNVSEAAIDNPMVLIKVSEDDLNRMIATQNLDMLLGIQNDLSKQKYEVLNRLKGSMIAVLTNDDGSIFTINATFNGGEAPKCTFRMKTTDSAALIRKEQNPVNLFMSGLMKIEGDMAFAMSTQPLFT
ncbi:MAG: SCP2 sterol-binding domain-containing protein [Deltaproteobacteria bacterium]|nr:SCP2 sterol-binding domain-containing protein [Deltaproteobacteria bacterium]